MVFTEDPSIRIRQIGGIRMDQMIRYFIYRFHFSHYRSVCVILLYSFLRISRESNGKRERERERQRERDKERERQRERDKERETKRERQRERDKERETKRERKRKRKRKRKRILCPCCRQTVKVYQCIIYIFG